MRCHLVSASALSGSTAAHMPAICDLFAADPPLTETPSRTMTILGARLGNSGHKSRAKKDIKSDNCICSVPRLDLGNISCSA